MPPSEGNGIVDQIANLRAGGLSFSEVADRLGLTKGVVAGIVFRRIRKVKSAKRPYAPYGLTHNVTETRAQRKRRKVVDAAR